MRQKFQETLMEMREAQRAHLAFQESISHAFSNAVVTLARKHAKNKRLAAYKKLDHPDPTVRNGAAWKLIDHLPVERDDLMRELTTKSDYATQRWDALRKSFDAALDALSKDAAPSPGESFVKVSEVSPAAYSTQGLGAERYARAAADLDAMLYRVHGIEAEVRDEQEPSSYRPGVKLRIFRVYAKILDLQTDRELVKRKGIETRDMIKWCWKNGVNPRVYNPWLPPGLEERLGLDYFGNDKAKTNEVRT